MKNTTKSQIIETIKMEEKRLRNLFKATKELNNQELMKVYIYQHCAIINLMDELEIERG